MDVLEVLTGVVGRPSFTCQLRDLSSWLIIVLCVYGVLLEHRSRYKPNHHNSSRLHDVVGQNMFERNLQCCSRLWVQSKAVSTIVSWTALLHFRSDLARGLAVLSVKAVAKTSPKVIGIGAIRKCVSIENDWYGLSSVRLHDQVYTQNRPIIDSGPRRTLQISCRTCYALRNCNESTVVPV